MVSWTQADLDALNQAIAQGARKVKYGDKEVEYQDLHSMLRARALIRQELGLAPRRAIGVRFG